MAPSSPSSAATPVCASSRKRKATAKVVADPEPDLDQDAAADKRPRKGTSSSGVKKPPKKEKASRKKEEAAAAEKLSEDEVCGEEPDEEELALGEDEDLAAAGDQEGAQEAGAAARKRVAKPTKAPPTSHLPASDEAPLRLIHIGSQEMAIVVVEQDGGVQRRDPDREPGDGT